MAGFTQQGLISVCIWLVILRGFTCQNNLIATFTPKVLNLPSCNKQPMCTNQLRWWRCLATRGEVYKNYPKVQKESNINSFCAKDKSPDLGLGMSSNKCNRRSAQMHVHEPNTAEAFNNVCVTNSQMWMEMSEMFSWRLNINNINILS